MLVFLGIYAATVPDGGPARSFWVGPLPVPVVSLPAVEWNGRTSEQQAASLVARARAVANQPDPPPDYPPFYARVHGPWAIGCIAIGAGLIAAGRRVGVTATGS